MAHANDRDLLILQAKKQLRRLTRRHVWVERMQRMLRFVGFVGLSCVALSLIDLIPTIGPSPRGFGNGQWRLLLPAGMTAAAIGFVGAAALDLVVARLDEAVADAEEALRVRMRTQRRRRPRSPGQDLPDGPQPY